ncbi:hypothetical protein TREES_T100021651 [Tupaia chinensis]|uniref:Uncharacterized protein n=1 Tax=Tupaia chinensis TaxID=246437 RepID=L9JLX0_TUPCH|nr:hypothetical protein TREES_T100021651 [Tupaia chinensis]
MGTNFRTRRNLGPRAPSRADQGSEGLRQASQALGCPSAQLSRPSQTLVSADHSKRVDIARRAFGPWAAVLDSQLLCSRPLSPCARVRKVLAYDSPAGP